MLKTLSLRRFARNTGVVCETILFMSVGVGAVHAQSAPANPTFGVLTPVTPDPYHELETKYLFGFTEGADIGAQGEQSVEFESTTQFGRRFGHYATLEQEVEYENVPTQNFGYELSAHGLGYAIQGVNGLTDAQGVNFSGLSTELRYLVIGRGPGSPIGFTLVAEPEWVRIDDGGQPVTEFSTNFLAIADTELIPNRLYGAVNASYTPDIAQSPGEAWERTSQLGASAALAYRFTPKITAGGEVQYSAAFDGLGPQSLQGQALYIGPTFHVQFTGQIMLSAAFSTQIVGRAVGEHNGLDLTDFPKQLGNLKVEFEF
jgi:hypothetical protein